MVEDSEWRRDGLYRISQSIRRQYPLNEILMQYNSLMDYAVLSPRTVLMYPVHVSLCQTYNGLLLKTIY